jgi:hypothetical protein
LHFFQWDKKGNVTAQWAAWWSGYILNLYLGGTCFKSWLGYCLSWVLQTHTLK